MLQRLGAASDLLRELALAPLSELATLARGGADTLVLFDYGDGTGLSVLRPTLPGLSPDWITPDGGLRLRPDYWADKGGMDGFFLARLRKPG